MRAVRPIGGISFGLRSEPFPCHPYPLIVSSRMFVSLFATP